MAGAIKTKHVAYTTAYPHTHMDLKRRIKVAKEIHGLNHHNKKRG